MNKIHIKKYLCIYFILVALTSLSGCRLNPEISNAYAYRVGDKMFISVEIPASDAALIKSRQLYFSIVVFDCEDSTNGFPIEPYINDMEASSFEFTTDKPTAIVSGTMPAMIFNKESPRCVFLRGGGYLAGKLRSESVAIAISK